MAREQERWRRRLEKELAFRGEFDDFTKAEWKSLLEEQRVLSDNHDTELAIDWPHYCSGATAACGGPKGWCYTFVGFQASASHNRRAALVDSLARKHPALFGKAVAKEVQEAVADGRLPYPNLRFSGSGEVHPAHLPALLEIRKYGIHLWGFCRNLNVAASLNQHAIQVLFSCDETTPRPAIEEAQRTGLRLAYTSSSYDDLPPAGTLVVFPLHRGGRVREVVESDLLCPKVLQDFFEEKRARGTCQALCTRCHR